MAIRVDAPFAHRSEVGEGPHWDGAGLLYVDIPRGEVHRLDIDSGWRQTVAVDGPVGFVVPGRVGELIVGRRSTVEGIDEHGRTMRVLATVEPDLADTRVNDGKCDPRGRLYFGTLSAKERPVAGFYRTSASDSTDRVFDGVVTSNGLGWDEGRNRLYYVDSALGTVDLLDYDLSTGEVANRRPFARIDRTDGVPDGLTLDAEGGVWVSLFAGRAVRRYGPEGELSEVVRMPVSHPTSAAFGGPDLRTLFVTTARIRLSEADLAEQPLAGAVLALDVGIAGLPAHAFAG